MTWHAKLGCLAAVLGMTCGISAMVAAEEPPRMLEGGARQFVGAETCMACHQAEYDEWRASKHAAAFSPTFTTHWEENHRSPACLACHTTGFDASHQRFAHQGVSCEACHGAMASGHPETEQMLLPTDSSVCMSCHETTYREWQLSGHARHNIRCFDCHEVHKQGLRRAQVDSQCGACHPQRLEDFAHATHHLQGLTCTTCHMPQRARASTFAGTGAPAHSWTVGVETCAACHEEMVHKSHKIPSLTNAVAQLSQQAEVQRAAQLESKLRDAELALDVQRARVIKGAAWAFFAGLLFGGFILMVGRRP